MDDFAKLPVRDHTELFQTVAAQRGLLPAIIEKDFWVCWTLRRLFTLQELPSGLLFKGGTSLSKVFKVIERFSEDIDLSFDRRKLGYDGRSDPLAASSRKQRQKSLKALATTCRQVIRERFLPQLQEVFALMLGGTHTAGWSLELAEDDPEQQTINFLYPTIAQSRSAEQPAYIRPIVRLEMGARSEHWPAADGLVTPFVAESFANLFRVGTCQVHVLAAERTFWEKATVLHSWYHAPPGKVLRDRQSRHYYDVVRLYEHGIGQKAIENTDLLLKVAEHKEAFFPCAWARYKEARPGSLRLVPPNSRLRELRQDYQSMREMIFGDVPTFDHLLGVLAEIESTVNG